MKKIIFAVFVLVILFTACKKENDRPPGEINTIIIRNGSKWVYKNTQFNESGGVVRTFEATFIAREQTISGSQWFTLIDQDSNSFVSYQQRNDGWWYKPYLNTEPSLFAKDPAAVNDQWLMTQLNGLSDTAKIKALNVTINASDIQYSGCTHVQTFNKDGITADYYFRPDVILAKVNGYQEKSTGGVYVSLATDLISFIK